MTREAEAEEYQVPDQSRLHGKKEGRKGKRGRRRRRKKGKEGRVREGRGVKQKGKGEEEKEGRR